MRTASLLRLQEVGRPKRGLTYRMVLAACVMAIVMIGTFSLLLDLTVRVSDEVSEERRARAVLISGNKLENLVMDLDMYSRTFILTGDRRFLRAYNTARSSFAERTTEFEHAAVNDHADEGRQARQIVQADNSYLDDYLTPLMQTTRKEHDNAQVGKTGIEVNERGYSTLYVQATRNDHTDARAGMTIDIDDERLAELRDRHIRFTDARREIVRAREQDAVATAHETKTTALAIEAGSLILIVLFIIYLMETVVHPVRRLSAMTSELAEGDLAARMPETSPGEIGMLENSFNTMAGALEANRDELRLVAEEQRALRRIATLVARGVAPQDLFTAVAAESGQMLDADHTGVIRYEPDNTVTVVAYWNNPRARRLLPPLDGHWPVEEGTVAATVLASGRSARMTCEHSAGPIGIWAPSTGIRCVVGCPVNVEGQIWGAMFMGSLTTEAPPCTEERMRRIVELVSTAIANAQSRSDLLASRARVVAAADESRQRLERRLHDGTQQRLVSLGLRLRMTEDSVAAEHEEFREQLSAASEELSQALAEVQDISRGIAPSTLTAKGLPNTLRSLARRSQLPVELDVHIDQKLPEPIQTAIYYIVSEALTNAAEHARASVVDVRIRVQGAPVPFVRLSINDDGVGGADLHDGSGLLGLKDRIDALNGTLEVVSPAGHGTSLQINLPISHRDQGASAGLRDS